MGIEIAPLLARYICASRFAFCLERQIGLMLAGDSPSAWRTVRLASRRDRYLLLAENNALFYHLPGGQRNIRKPVTTPRILAVE